MEYQRYTTEDFVLDEAFQDWVFHPTSTSDRFFSDFIQRYPEKEPAIEKAREKLAAIQFHQHTVDKKMYQRIRRKLEVHTEAEPSKRQIVSIGLRARMMPYLVAASLAIFLLVGIGLWNMNDGSRVLYQTTYAETKRVRLPDSTLVVLNANSTIRLNNHHDGPLREVWLDGEAFFDIVENKHRPFVVHVDDIEVRVTGTSFTIDSRFGKTQVVLASGEIQLDAEALPETLRMVPGDLIAYNKVTKQVQHQSVEPERYMAWLERVYYFEDTPLKEVAAVIETYYGKEVTIDSSLEELRFTAKVTLHPKADPLLTLLSETFDLRIIENQNQIKFQMNKR